MCVCVCACACVRACVRVCVRANLYSHIIHYCVCAQDVNGAAYIVYVTSLAILCMVTARGKMAGVTNDKESVLL